MLYPLFTPYTYKETYSPPRWSTLEKHIFSPTGYIWYSLTLSRVLVHLNQVVIFSPTDYIWYSQTLSRVLAHLNQVVTLFSPTDYIWYSLTLSRALAHLNQVVIFFIVWLHMIFANPSPGLSASKSSGLYTTRSPKTFDKTLSRFSISISIKSFFVDYF